MRVIAAIDVRRAHLTEFHDFERLAVERMEAHGGRLEDVTLVDDGVSPTVTELHVLHFPDAAAWQAYQQDPQLASRRSTRERCVVGQRVWVGEPGPRPAGSQDGFRHVLAQALAAHVAGDAREAADLRLMRFALQSLARPFARDTWPGHFTSSALIADAQLEQVCLLHHVKLARWLQPGGHVEPTDADFVAGALREAREETGLPVVVHPAAGAGLLDVDVHVIPARKHEPEHQHLDLRVLLCAPLEPPRPPAGESQQVRWFSLAEARQLQLDAALVRLLEKVERLAAQRPVR